MLSRLLRYRLKVIEAALLTEMKRVNNDENQMTILLEKTLQATLDHVEQDLDVFEFRVELTAEIHRLQSENQILSSREDAATA